MSVPRADYYAEAGRDVPPGREEQAWRAWQGTVRNAVAYAESLPSVAGRPVALVGHSRGAFLAVSVAGFVPCVRAVVDFYGGGSNDDPPEDQIAHFPPVLILHGEADREVSVELAHRLYDRIRAHGGEVEMHLYPGVGHVFNGPWARTYSPADAADAWRRSVRFLRERLSGDVPIPRVQAN